MRTSDEPRDEPPDEELLDPELITRPARITPSRMVPGETASVPCAHAERTSMAEGTAAMGRTRMHDMVLRGYSVDDRMVGTTYARQESSFGATCRLRRKPSNHSELCLSVPCVP